MVQLLEGKSGIRDKGNLSDLWWGRVEDEQVESSAQGVKFGVPTMDITTKTTREMIQNTVKGNENSRTPTFGM